MLKRLLLIVALGATFAACGPSSSSPGTDTSPLAPSPSLITESAAPS